MKDIETFGVVDESDSDWLGISRSSGRGYVVMLSVPISERGGREASFFIKTVVTNLSEI